MVRRRRAVAAILRGLRRWLCVVTCERKCGWRRRGRRGLVLRREMAFCKCIVRELWQSMKHEVRAGFSRRSDLAEGKRSHVNLSGLHWFAIKCLHFAVNCVLALATRRLLLESRTPLAEQPYRHFHGTSPPRLQASFESVLCSFPCRFQHCLKASI